MRPGAKWKPTAILEDELKLHYEPPKDLRWQLGIFELRKWEYQIYNDRSSDNVDLTIDESEQTLLFCWNFNEDEIKAVLIDQMRVNPIVYYEVLLTSTIDKVFEFNDVVIFFNIVIPSRDDHPENHIILKVVKKGNVAAMFINDVDYKNFDFED